MFYFEIDIIFVKFLCRVKVEMKDKEEESFDIGNNSCCFFFISVMLIKWYLVMYWFMCLLYSNW